MGYRDLCDGHTGHETTGTASESGDFETAGGRYECCPLLGHRAMWFMCEQAFRKDVSPPSSWSKISRARNEHVAGGLTVPGLKLRPLELAACSQPLYRLRYRGSSSSVRRLLVTANVPSSPILVTMMKEALGSS
jgi:hypothetical protein